MSATHDWQAGWRKPDRGTLFVLNGPSGSGKSTLTQYVVKTIPWLTFSVSLTTRAPRGTERQGVDYVFTDREDFEDRIRGGELLEHVELYGNYYGTRKDATTNTLRRGESLIMEINDRGLEQMRQHRQHIVSIFVLPPSIDVLRERLVARGRETPAEVDERVVEAEREMRHRGKYDYLINNVDVCTARMQIQSIIVGELSRRGNQHSLLGAVANNVLHEP